MKTDVLQEELSKIDQDPHLSPTGLAIYMLALPSGALFAAVLAYFGYFSWIAVGIMMVMNAITLFGIEVGFHRYFSHRSFRTSRKMEILLAGLGSMAGQGGVLWWTAIHRDHHRHSDQEGDPHSPTTGSHDSRLDRVVYAHFGWIFDPENTKAQGGWIQRVKHWHHHHHLLAIQRDYPWWVLMGISIPILAGFLLIGGWEGALLGGIWGGPVRICLSSHSFWAINSVCHTWGGRPFSKTHDNSRNNALVALLTFGQGWHNNHHAFPSSAYLQFEWWQVDVGGWLIRCMEKIGLVWKVNECTSTMIAQKRGHA